MRKFCLCVSPLALVGAIACAIIAFAVFPSIIEKKVEKEILIKNGTEAWDRFVTFPIPLQWKIHFFNLTSGYENFDGNVSKLEFEEVGPYIYDENWTKRPILYEQDGVNMSYVLRRVYNFNQKLSGNRRESDQVTTLNPVLTTPLKSFIKDLVVTDSIDSISFNGTNKFIQFVRYAFFTGEGFEGDHYAAEEDDLVIKTGVGSPKDILQIEGFLTGHANVWNDTFGNCNVPKGTDGTQFHPNVKSEDILHAYEPLICRSLSFTNNLKSYKLENTEVRDIKTLRYVAEDKNFLQSNKDNECYCYPEDPQPCEDDTLSLKHCNKADGKDIVASTPYFLANEQLRNKIGMKAPKTVNHENYGTIVDVEPITGTTLSARKRLQLNIRLTRDPAHPLLKDLNEKSVLIPLLWVEEGADLDEKNAEMLKDKIFRPKRLVTLALIITMCVCVVLSVAAFAVYCFASK